ncbi:MAG TPA: hypothetical protein VMT85_16210 [Thermoanaerobaculia bacterium]|nr:hypothetical protein [Thermoanaerobaculia bacterium]
MNNMLKPALIGGGVLGVLSGIPFVSLGNCACCAWVIGGGMLAAYLFNQQIGPQPATPYGPAAGLGALTGVIGAVVAFIVALPFNLMGMASGLTGVQETLQNVEGLPPEVQDAFANMGAAGVGIGMAIFGFVISLVVYALFAMIGALIGIALFGRK